MTERQITHFVGDECEPNGHRPDTLIERLRDFVGVARSVEVQALREEAAAALERAERVVEAAREWNDHDVTPEPWTHDRDMCEAGANLTKALVAYDAAGKEPFRVESRTTLRREAVQRGEEVPTFDASDQHFEGLKANEEEK